MKKIIILPFLFLGFLSWGQAQFVVQNAAKAKTEVYNNINTAINSAESGDTLYLPGGGYTVTNATIDKALHWVGHGHYPDSTKATMQTRITTSLYFTGNCDNSSFEGILFTSYLNFGSADDEAINIKLKRCRVMNTLSLRATENIDNGNPDLNFQISECVLASVNAKYGMNCLVEKSLIFSYIDNFVQSNFDHNSINVNGSSTYNYSAVRKASSCSFSNNAFGLKGNLDGSSSITLTNNIYAEGLPSSSEFTTSENMYNVGTANIYTTITGNVYSFDYDNDYHLNTAATGTRESDSTTGISILGTAGDGTNAGVYGTTAPYKTIPYYPHINTATIASEAVNGQLGVNIGAQAQSR